MAFKLNWTKALATTGMLVASVIVMYGFMKLFNPSDDDDEDEHETHGDEHNPYKQVYNNQASVKKVDKMSKRQCHNLLKSIVESQEETKKLLSSMVDDILSRKVPANLLGVYEKVLPVVPTDPLEANGLTLFDLDHVVDKYQNDNQIRECILKIMNVSPPDDLDCELSTDEVIKVHEFMLNELEKHVSNYKKIPQKDSMSRKAITISVQALISARIQEKFGFNFLVVDKAILKNHSELSMNTKFARLTMQIQSEMSELTGVYS